MTDGTNANGVPYDKVDELNKNNPNAVYTGDRSKGDAGWVYTNVTSGPSSALGNLETSSNGQDPDATIQSIIRSYLTYNPQISQQLFDDTAKYVPRYQALNQSMISRERQSSLADAASMAPQLQAIRDASDRGDVRAMRDKLYASVLGDLNAGETLTPEQDRNAVQSVRSAQAARGLNGGQSGANIEAVRRALSGQTLGVQRKAAASSVLASEASQKADPFATILGMNTPATTAAISQTANNQAQFSPSVLSSAFFGAQQANQAANQYNLTLQLAKLNPYLYKS